MLSAILAENSTRSLIQSNINNNKSIGSNIKSVKSINDQSLTKSRKEHAAIIIQKKFREYKKRKESIATNEFGIKKLTSSQKNFYYDKDGTFLVRTPNKHYKSINKDKSGSYKFVMAQDDKFIEHRINNKNFKVNKVKFNQLMLEQLKSYTSICTAIYVNDSTMISQYGGDDLFHFIHAGVKINTLKFRILLYDLKNLHKKDFFICDIKPENCTYDGNLVRLIDLDNLVLEDNNRRSTKGYRKTNLKCLSLCGDQSEKKKAKQLHDNYAILKTMIQSTLAQHLDIDTDNRNYTPLAKNIFSNWIKKNIAISYQTYALELLFNPKSFADPIAIYDMIDWKKIENNTKKSICNIM